MATRSRQSESRGAHRGDEAPPAEKRAAAHHAGELPFRLQRLEPRLLWAIAAFSLWMAIVLYPAEPIAWLLAAYAAAFGAWAQNAPPRTQVPMFIRAALLLVGAFLFQVTADASHAEGPQWILPLAVTAAYSLLLSGPAIGAMWVLAAAEFLIARWIGSNTAQWPVQMTHAGAMVLMAYLARAYAISTTRLDEFADAARRDRSSHLYNEAGFFAHGSELFEACHSRKRPFTLVLVNSSDLREASVVAGRKAATQLFAQLVECIEAATPPGAVAARTDSFEFAMAMPGITAARAAALLHGSLGPRPQVEVTLKGKRITVMLDLVIAETTRDVATLEDMYDRLRAKLLMRAGDNAFMPSEAHSTLMGMYESDSVIPRDERPTMPMALSTEPAPLSATSHP